MRDTEPIHDFGDDRLGTRLDLRPRLILNRMLHVHGVEIGPPQLRSLRPRRRAEFVRRYRHRRNSQAF